MSRVKSRKYQAHRGPFLVRGLAAGIATAVLVLAGTGAAVAADPAMTIRITAATSSVQSGGQLSYLVNYACSTLVATCPASTLTLPPPGGTAPAGGTSIVPSFASISPNADVVAQSGADAGATVQLRDLVGGAAGQITINWVAPNLLTLPGTTFTQSATVSAPGLASASATSAPVTVTATAQLNAGLTMVTPSAASAVGANANVTYRTFDCNPGSTSLGGLGYSGVSLVLTLPTGVTIVDAAGGAVSGSTITWTDPNPTTNNCGAPDRVHLVTVQYPGSTFVPAPATPPLLNTVNVSLAATATGLDGTSISATPAQLEHIFRGPPGVLPTGYWWLNWSKWNYHVSSQQLGLTSIDTTSEYDFGLANYWYMEHPGKVANNPGIYETQAVQDRLPCVSGGTAVSPANTGNDPILTNPPPAWPAPVDQCLTPAFKIDHLQFGNIVTPSIELIEVYTTDGTGLGGHYSWQRTTPADAVHSALYLDVYGNRSAVSGPSSAPTLGLGRGRDDLGNEADEAAADVPALFDETFTDPEIVDLGVPADETITDLRIVYTYVPYYTWMWAGIVGTSTPAFAASGLMQMTNEFRAWSIANAEYTISQPPRYGGLAISSPARSFTEQFRAPQPDPRVRLIPSTDVTALAPGQVAEWTATVTNGASGSPLNPKVVVVIPPGMELIDGSESWSDLAAVDDVIPTREVVVQSGYTDGIPRQSIVWTWPPGQRIDNPDDTTSPDHASFLAERMPTLTFRTRVAVFAREGSHTGDDAMSVTAFDGAQALPPGGTSVPLDTQDLDGDGIVNEQVGFASFGWTAAATSGARIVQAVRGDADADWSTTGTTGGGWPVGGSAEYRILISNDNTVPIGDIVVYDVLPYLGDTGIGEALAGEPRGSGWQPEFAGITASGGAQVAYSTSTNPCRPELFHAAQGPCDAWLTSPPADLTTVRALRFTIAGPYAATTASNPPLELRFAVTTPPVEPTASDAVADLVLAASVPGTANNNVAWRATRLDPNLAPVPFEPAEAPVTTLEVVSGMLGGIVWFDGDGDSIRDPGEPGVSGISVALLDVASAPILDGSATPVVAVTRADGTYGFDLPLGAFRVGFSGWAAQYTLVPAHRGGDPDLDSDPDPGTAVTDAVTLTSVATSFLDIDAGLTSGILTIEKTADASHAMPGDLIDFTLVVRNIAPTSAAVGVVVLDSLPSTLEFVSSDPAAIVSGQLVEFDLGDLPAGATVTLTVVARVSASLAAGEDIVNVGSVTGATPCANPDCTSLATLASDVIARTGPDVSPALIWALILLLVGCALNSSARRRVSGRAQST